MNKKGIIAIVLSVVLVVGAGFGVAGIAGVFSPNESSSTNQSTVESSSANSSSSSSSSLQEETLVKVEMPNVSEELTANFKAINLKEVYMVGQGETAVMVKVFNGLTLGEIACSLLSEELPLGYYSDGNWYTTAENGKLKKCGKVLSAIFNYEIGGGKPLNLSQSDLSKFGNDLLITYFEDQFGFEISSLLELIPNDVMPGVLGLSKRVLKITVRDLYDLTNGDYTYVRNFIEQTDVDEITHLLFDVLTMASESELDYKPMRDVIVKLLNGKITAVEVDESVEIIDFIDAYPAWDNKTKHKLSNYYFDSTVGTFKQDTLKLDVDEIIDILVIIAEAEGVSAEETGKWSDRMKVLLNGTLENLTVDQNGDIEGVVTDLLEMAKVENSTQVASDIVPVIKALLTLMEKSNEQEESRAQSIEDLIISVFNCDMENQAVNAFVKDLSTAINSVISGSSNDLEFFAKTHESLTLGEVDQYLGGKIKQIIGAENFEKVSSITVGEIYEGVKVSIDNSSVNPEELFESIKNTNGDIKQIITEIEEFYNAWLAENKDKTIGEMLGDSVELDAKIASIKIGEILDFNSDHSLKLSTLDDLIFACAIENLLKDTGLENLLDLTVSDCASIIKLQASENALEVLESVKLIDLINFIQEFANEQGESVA